MWFVWPTGKLRCTIIIKVRDVETLNDTLILLPALASHRCCRHSYSLVSNFHITSCNVTAPNPQGLVCCHVAFIKLVFQCHTTAAFDITQSTFFSLSKYVLHYVFPRSTGIHFSIRLNFQTVVSSAVGSFLSVLLAFWLHNIFPIKYCFRPLFRSYTCKTLWGIWNEVEVISKYCRFPYSTSSLPHTRVYVLILIIIICLWSRRHWPPLRFTVLASNSLFCLAPFAGLLSALLLYVSVSTYRLRVSAAVNRGQTGGSLVPSQSYGLGKEWVAPTAATTPAWPCECSLETIEQHIQSGHISWVWP